MILGRKDKERVATLERDASIQATNFFKQLHDDHNITYTAIAEKLEVSQQYVNDIALGKKKIKNRTFYKLLAKLFD